MFSVVLLWQPGCSWPLLTNRKQCFAPTVVMVINFICLLKI